MTIRDNTIFAAQVIFKRVNNALSWQIKHSITYYLFWQIHCWIYFNHTPPYWYVVYLEALYEHQLPLIPRDTVWKFVITRRFTRHSLFTDKPSLLCIPIYLTDRTIVSICICLIVNTQSIYMYVVLLVNDTHRYFQFETTSLECCQRNFSSKRSDNLAAKRKRTLSTHRLVLANMSNVIDK